MENYYFYLLIFAAALVVAVFTTPQFIKLAVKLGAVDQPGPRRVNVKPITRMGGPAMFLGFTAAVVVAVILRKVPPMYAIGVLSGSAIVFGVGLWDDLRSLKPVPKLLAHITAGCVAFGFGVRISFVTNPFGGGMIILPEWVSLAVTVFWLIGTTNAMNLIDGLDGLAAGIVTIATLTFFLVANGHGQTDSALMSLALAGAAGGFLRWNFYPAKTIMGDSGAYFLGFTAAALAVNGAFKSTTAITLLVPIFALGLPIFDTTFAIARRLHDHKPVMHEADKKHVHHRLLASGFNHRQTVMVCYLITLALSAAALAIGKEWLLAVYLFAAVVALVVLLIGVGKVVKRKKERVEIN